MNRFAALLTSTLLMSGSLFAQQEAPRLRTFSFTQEMPMPGMNLFVQHDKVPDGEVAFFSAELASGGETVTDAPYTATAVTESTQVLGDGNRIVNKTSSFVARDSQGRTRRETTLSRIGNVQVDSPKLVFISDPTKHTQYVLQDGDGRKIVRSESTWSSGPTIINTRDGNVNILHDKIATARRQRGESGITIETVVPDGRHEITSDQTKHEDLGTQTMEGVSAEGKRETVTIPAGQIGNERAIEIVSETWYSPELHTMVMRKHSDPRVGETVFRLTDIRRTEPDAALFQPPANMKLKTEPLLEFKQRMAPPKE